MPPSGDVNYDAAKDLKTYGSATPLHLQHLIFRFHRPHGGGAVLEFRELHHVDMKLVDNGLPHLNLPLRNGERTDSLPINNREGWDGGCIEPVSWDSK